MFNQRRVAVQAHRRITALVATTLVGLVIVGCTPEHSRPSGSTSKSGSAYPSASHAPTLTAVWQTKTKAFSTPQLVGGRVVFAAAINKTFFWIGLDPTDGHEVWRQQFQAYMQAEQDVELNVIDGRLVYIRPARTANKGDARGRLVIADPTSGRDLFVSSEHAFVSRPEPCPDRATLICTDLVVEPNDPLNRGAVAEIGQRDLQPYRGPAYRGVFDTQVSDTGLFTSIMAKDPNTIIGVRHGLTDVWHRSTTQVFGPNQYPFRHQLFPVSRQSGLFVGSPTPGGTGKAADRFFVRNLSASESVGFRASDGAPVWRVAGGSAFCDGLLALTAPDTADLPDYPVRCAYRGTQRVDSYTDNATFSNLFVTVEGFDPATGKTTWSVPLGRAPALVLGKYQRDPAIVDEHTIIVAGSGGPVTVDIAKGVKSTATKPAWCPTHTRLQLPSRDDYVGTYESDKVWHPCTVAGQPSDALPSTVPPDVGPTVGGVSFVASADAVTAYRTS